MAQRPTILLILCLLTGLSACMKPYPAQLRFTNGDTGEPLHGVRVRTWFHAYLEPLAPAGDRYVTDSNGTVRINLYKRPIRVYVEDPIGGIWNFSLFWKGCELKHQQPDHWSQATALLSISEADGEIVINVGVLRTKDCEFTFVMPDAFEGFFLIRRQGTERSPSAWKGPRTPGRPSERIFIVPPFAVMAFVDSQGRRLEDWVRPVCRFDDKVGNDEVWGIAPARRIAAYENLARIHWIDDHGSRVWQESPARIDWIRSDLLSGGDGMINSGEVRHPAAR